MIRKWICLFGVLASIAAPGILQVQAIEVYAKAKEVEAVNGTNVKLQCTFKSTEPISEDSVIVSWNFKPLNNGPEEAVFHYQENPFPPTEGRFKGHAVWSGDIMGEDASISLNDVQFSFNGTYSCQVHNPPDFEGFAAEVILKVVLKASVSDIQILAASVGGAIAVIIVILIIFAVLRKRLRRNREPSVELREPEWKDPTVCKPEEAIHLMVVAKAVAAGSSDDDDDDEESDDDDDDEDDGEDEDDDDDDDDDDGDDDDDD
ncbi:hypothetical protein ACEWY4_010061 [Coilia grayii]|uniref:Ig-like domain-containing protein n=1 Tax=Coilia grayii TaxID=363190 RepID=A0ABD1K8B3_9TELE